MRFLILSLMVLSPFPLFAGIPESQAQPGGVYWRLPDGSLSASPPGQTSVDVPAVTIRERGISITGPFGGQLSIGRTVVDLHNAERRARGLAPLSVDPGLTSAAQAQANAQASAGRMFHSTRPLPGTGENVAAGQTTDEQVARDWYNSPGHRANILNGTYTRIGVGRVGNFWAVTFGR